VSARDHHPAPATTGAAHVRSTSYAARPDGVMRPSSHRRHGDDVSQEERPMHDDEQQHRSRSSRTRRMSGVRAGRGPGGPLAVGTAIALACTTQATAAAAPAPAECATSPTGAVLVTPDCVDPLYATPVVDTDEERSDPVPHRAVTGQFAESPDIRFQIHLPPTEQWEGRFFQYTYPLTDERATDDAIAFGAASGAYTVQAGGPPPVLGCRHAAAAARFARTVAAQHYWSGDRPIHGYLYGPSGGSYQTVGAAESTTGVWDGYVPMVLGVPMSAPYTFFVRGLADLVLGPVAGQTSDAVQPGGSGDPYAGLDEAQRAVLRELTAFGVPPRGWEDPRYLLGRDPRFYADGLMGFGSVVRQVDPGFADDFWGRPGYLGTERSALGDVVRAPLIDSTATVVTADGPSDGALRLTLAGLPAADGPRGLDLTVPGPDGTAVTATGRLDPATGTVTVPVAADGSGDAAVAALVPGAQVRADNRWDLALRSYHRHQLPPAADGYPGFAQFRAADGSPLHPQRALVVGPTIAGSSTGGATHSGRITGRMIVVDNLVDTDALPHHADWYAGRVRAALGDDAFADRFRLYYSDAADHQDAPVDGVRATHLVDWNGAVEQALRDLAAWEEDGVEPSAPTRYDVLDGQVVVPQGAAERRGVQPVAELTANGADRVEVVAGQPIALRAEAAVPPGTGEIVEIAFDPTGSGDFTPVIPPRRVRPPRRSRPSPTTLPAPTTRACA
jgi:hypothetical protein